MDIIKPITCMVHYNRDEWTKFSTHTFLSNTNLPLLVVDNSPNHNFRELVDSDRITVVINESEKKSHGDGIDLTIDWSRKNEFTHIVHIEHDCVVGGTKWFDMLYDKAKEGYAHVYSLRRPHGAHPTPSIWQISEIRHSFATVTKGEDKNEDFYKSLDIDVSNSIKRNNGYQDKYWDTGMKNWYELEKLGKSIRIDEQKDFLHCWACSYNKEAIKLEDRAGWSKLLRDYNMNQHKPTI